VGYCCERDDRRDAVRRMKGWNGLDYVEVGNDWRTLTVFFLGKLPPEFVGSKPENLRYLILEGGQRVTDIGITSVKAVVNPDPEKDDFLVVKLDKVGDFSAYTVRLVGVKNIDPRYDRATFFFKIDCPSDLDCAPACACEPPILQEPEISYLARDYASFRQLILDRLAVLVPDWKERHVPDLGIMLVEALAYTADYLSYYQDAVATEAYLDTARQRISVRRHIRLVDYRLSEGCNARAWLSLEVSSDLSLNPADTSFITGLNDALAPQPGVLKWEELRDVPGQAYEVFEPVILDGAAVMEFRTAHNEVRFYAWGEKECCLAKGSTSATLLDQWMAAGSGTDETTPVPDKGGRALQLAPGDVLIFEEVLGPVTGSPSDADPARRHAVRLTRVSPGEDPTCPDEAGRPTPYLEVEWSRQDALPFPLCLSTIGPAPDCRYLDGVTVARGNVILVDHGKTQEPEPLGTVPTSSTDAWCECAEEPGEIQIVPGRMTARLGKQPLTFRSPFPVDDATPGRLASASSFLRQDTHQALPQVRLNSNPAEAWESRYDLIDSRPGDRHFVVEIDNDGMAHLRFGDGEMGWRPPAAMEFTAAYRVGNGNAGNVGAESISRLVLKNTTLSGVAVAVRNPLPAAGGTDPESVAEAKLLAPHLFRNQIERAIIAADYAEIAQRWAEVQKASASLTWTGSWYEADVAIDPFGREDEYDPLLAKLAHHLERYRRMGHDLALQAARYVPLYLSLCVCASPHYDRGHVKAALLAAFGTRALPGGKRGFFHPDEVTFGEGIYLSRIIAVAQAVPGVESVQVEEFHRLFESANHEKENGLLPLSSREVAQLDNDPNFPERGRLVIEVGGGR
jgi:hypothetical protein